MKHISRYKNFKSDKMVSDWVSESITDKEFFNFLNEEILNESLIDRLKNKFFDVVNKLIDKVIELGFKVYDKFISLVNFIKGKLDNMNPKVRSLIIIIIVVLIIIFLSISTVYAASNGEPMDISKVNMAIGLVDELLKKGDISSYDGMKAMAYLVDLRDGKMTLIDLDQKSVEIAKGALSVIEKSYSDVGELSDYSKELIKRGEETLNYVYQKSASSLDGGGFKSSEKISFIKK